MAAGFRGDGFAAETLRATFYVWSTGAKGSTSEKFCLKALDTLNNANTETNTTYHLNTSGGASFKGLGEFEVAQVLRRVDLGSQDTDSPQ